MKKINKRIEENMHNIRSNGSGLSRQYHNQKAKSFDKKYENVKKAWIIKKISK